MDFPTFLKKIRSQNASTRKVIFWVSVTVCALVLFSLWVWLAKQRMASFNRGKFRWPTPSLPEPLQQLPKFEVPSGVDSQLKEFEKLLQEASPQP